MQQNPFQSFIAGVKNVRNERELATLIASLGICGAAVAEQKIHPRFLKCVGAVGGWHDPQELASMLWGMKDLWKEQQIASFLEIGTFAGYTFFVVHEFIKAHVNPSVRAKTIDIVPIQEQDPIHDYIKDHFSVGSSDVLQQQQQHEQYDLVFIDGSTEASWLEKDFTNVPGFKQVVFLNSTWAPMSTKHQAQKETVNTIHALTQGYPRAHASGRAQTHMISVLNKTSGGDS